MMGLLSNIRSAAGKKGGDSAASVLAQADAEPIDARTRRVVIAEWPKLLEQNPRLFLTAWIRSANRSQSIKKAFGIAEDQSPEQNEAFVRNSRAIQNFFHNTIIAHQLDQTQMVESCERLGARHVDFIARGFNSTFWDIFLVCMAEVLDETLQQSWPDADKRREVSLAWQRVFHAVVHHMRVGYSERRRREMAKGTS